MRSIKICIGSNDQENIAKTHMGDTDFFLIYELFENSKNEFIEKRVNLAKSMPHGKADKMKAIIKLVADVDVFVAQQKSLNFINIASTTKYQPVIVEVEKISDILKVLNDAFSDIYKYVLERKKGEYFNNIPKLK